MLEHIQIQKGNAAQFNQLLDLWIPYCRETGNTESNAAIAEESRHTRQPGGHAL